MALDIPGPRHLPQAPAVPTDHGLTDVTVVRREQGDEKITSGDALSPREGSGPRTVVVAEVTDQDLSESVQEPAKVMRIAIMVRQLLEELRGAGLDEGGRTRLRKIHEQSIKELASTLSPDLAQELDRMIRPFQNPSPTEAELRVAQAQLVGWLEGLFRGIQATIFAQQVEAQLQLEKLRGQGSSADRATKAAADSAPDTGTYL